MDPQRAALQTVDTLLARARQDPLPAADCLKLAELTALVPGRARAIAETLADQADGASLDALLVLPPGVPGMIEGLFRTFARGVTRRRLDGSEASRALAIDFRHSRARDFSAILRRALAVFGPEFERLDVRGKTHYRFGLREGRGTLAGRVAAASQDLQWLHQRLGRLRGTRLWINGWCFDAHGRLGSPIQVHLVRAWITWASNQTATNPRELP